MDSTEKVKEIREKLKEQVLPEVIELVEARKKAGEKLGRLEKALPEHVEKEEALKLKLNSLIDEVAKALGEGEDPTKKRTEVRKTQDEIAETKATILSLQEKFIPEARAALRAAEDALKAATRKAMTPVRDEYEKRMAELIDDGIGYWEAWDDATKGFYGEFKIPLLAGTQGEVPMFHKHSERLNLYIRNVMGGVTR